MKPNVEQNKEFAKWFQNWIEVIKQGRVSVQHIPPEKADTLSETIKLLGFAQNNQVKLYGKVFDLVSDPVVVGKDLVFVDALERGSSKVLRVRIPPTIVRMARIKRHAT